jgi:flagellar M-ring protein FliF
MKGDLAGCQLLAIRHSSFVIRKFPPMDFLNQAIAQVTDLFRSMTPGARLTSGLLLAVVVVSVGYLFQYQTAGPDEFLFGGMFLPDGQINRVEAAIAQAGLSGSRRDGNRILVPSGQKALYLAAVVDGGALPPNFHTYLENALNQGGPWESNAATKERLRIAKQQMLSDIIRAMDWVEEAIVIYDEQQQRGLGRDRQVTGSVSIRPAIGESVDPRRAAMIQRLVAHAVVGLRAEEVAVTNLGESGPGLGGEVFADNFKSEYYQTLVSFEQYKKQNILNALRDIPGVRVEVKAELDDTTHETMQTNKPDPKNVAIREVTKESAAVQSSVGGGGQPGLTAQGPNRQGVLPELQRQKESETTTTDGEIEYFVGEERRIFQRTGLTPKEVWATVTIPQSYLQEIWKQQNPNAKEPPKPDDLTIVETKVRTNVENIVEPLLPRQNKGEDSFKQVKVVFLDSLPRPTIEAPSFADTAFAQLGRHANTLLMVGVAVFSLLVLRSVVRAVPVGGGSADAAGLGASTLTVHADDAADAGSAGSGDADEPKRSRLRIKKGNSLKDDLVTLVQEDPDAAAAILRSWIGKAG